MDRESKRELERWYKISKPEGDIDMLTLGSRNTVLAIKYLGTKVDEDMVRFHDIHELCSLMMCNYAVLCNNLTKFRKLGIIKTKIFNNQMHKAYYIRFSDDV